MNDKRFITDITENWASGEFLLHQIRQVHFFLPSLLHGCIHFTCSNNFTIFHTFSLLYYIFFFKFFLRFISVSFFPFFSIHIHKFISDLKNVTGPYSDLKNVTAPNQKITCIKNRIRSVITKNFIKLLWNKRNLILKYLIISKWNAFLSMLYTVL